MVENIGPKQWVFGSTDDSKVLSSNVKKGVIKDLDSRISGHILTENQLFQKTQKIESELNQMKGSFLGAGQFLYRKKYQSLESEIGKIKEVRKQNLQEMTKLKEQKELLIRGKGKIFESAHKQFEKAYSEKMRKTSFIMKELIGTEKSFREGTEKLESLYKDQTVPDDLRRLVDEELKKTAMKEAIKNPQTIFKAHGELEKKLNDHLSSQDKEILNGIKSQSGPINQLKAIDDALKTDIDSNLAVSLKNLKSLIVIRSAISIALFDQAKSGDFVISGINNDQAPFIDDLKNATENLTSSYQSGKELETVADQIADCYLKEDFNRYAEAMQKALPFMQQLNNANTSEIIGEKAGSVHPILYIQRMPRHELLLKELLKKLQQAGAPQKTIRKTSEALNHVHEMTVAFNEAQRKLEAS